ncbi:unnamed protein product [Adineta steineri]|uniref:Uncharacterized protein n=1 Tax=Adineta steineri TaxID=433720 RepID=A0A819DQ01_9BILA|nr:unnamed protein product [Adineta steineri]
MSIIVSSKISYFENYKKQSEFSNEDLDAAHISELFQTENNALIQLVIRDRHKKSTNHLNSNTLQKEMIDNEIYQLSNSYTQQNYNRFIQMNK